MLKHVCEHCLGTLAPEPPTPTAGGALQPSSASVCNRCGETRTEEQFMQRCAAHFEGDDDEEEDAHS